MVRKALAGTFTLVLLTSACGGNDEPGATGGDAEPRTLIVGASVDFPPLSFREEGSDDIQGFEVDMVEALTDSLGWEYEYSEFEFAGLVPALESGRVDTIISGLYVTPEREEVVDFLPYLRTFTGILTRASDASAITGPEDLCGLRIGVLVTAAVVLPLLEESSSACVDAGMPEIDIRPDYRSVVQELADIDRDRLDGILEDNIVNANIVRENDPKYAIAFAYEETPDHIGIALPKESELFEPLRQTLATYIASPDYAESAGAWSIPDTSLLSADEFEGLVAGG